MYCIVNFCFCIIIVGIFSAKIIGTSEVKSDVRCIKWASFSFSWFSTVLLMKIVGSLYESITAHTHQTIYLLLLYLITLLVSHYMASNYSLRNEKQIGKEVEGSGRGLSEGSIPAFSRTHWGKLWEYWGRIAGLRAEIQTRASKNKKQVCQLIGRNVRRLATYSLTCHVIIFT
jgi:hypothetical protein